MSVCDGGGWMHVKKAEKAGQRTYEVERAGSCLGDTVTFSNGGERERGGQWAGTAHACDERGQGKGEGAGQWARPMVVTCMTRLGVAGGGGGGHVLVVVLMLVRGAVEESGMHGCTKRPAVLPTPRSSFIATPRGGSHKYSTALVDVVVVELDQHVTEETSARDSQLTVHAQSEVVQAANLAPEWSPAGKQTADGHAAGRASAGDRPRLPGVGCPTGGAPRF
ncbi:hypothetical protein PCL_10277 [Purpureocillium lilacinum]|uniref:Uncharacterized protein n=1 Tax=Purpureocillium lilacinum TaxID=33203 RepID=A0A2U3EFM5_PURLI|nr:hypothetical protein PCL_10277 [Purpureocillium lilacinum]